MNLLHCNSTRIAEAFDIVYIPFFVVIDLGFGKWKTEAISHRPYQYSSRACC